MKFSLLALIFLTALLVNWQEYSTGLSIQAGQTRARTSATKKRRSAQKKKSSRKAPAKPDPVLAAIKNTLQPAQLAVGEPLKNQVGMLFAPIPAGAFKMGGRDSDPNVQSNEKPLHKVTLTRPFYLSLHEVTQKQYAAVMGERPWDDRPSTQTGDDYPATYVSWKDAEEFCSKLSALDNSRYRLPTEAEWEYACRAGTDTVYGHGDEKANLEEYTWYAQNASRVGAQFAHQVGQKKPNNWGLYDMHGNVWEWCSDWYALYDPARLTFENPAGPPQGSQRVLRGGAYNSHPRSTRSSKRIGAHPGTKGAGRGFRVVRELPAPPDAAQTPASIAYPEPDPQGPHITGKLPPDGSWVKYQLTITDKTKFDPDGKQTDQVYVLEITIRSVGREEINGVYHRWFEVEVRSNGSANGDAKILLSEPALQDSRQLPLYPLNLLSRTNRSKPVKIDRNALKPAKTQDTSTERLCMAFVQLFTLLDELLLYAQTDQIEQELVNWASVKREGFMSLKFPSPPFKIERLPAKIKTPHGELDGWDVKITGDWQVVFKGQIEWLPPKAPGDSSSPGPYHGFPQSMLLFWVGQLIGTEAQLAPDVPFGIVNFKASYEVPELNAGNQLKTKELGTLELQLKDFGTGAKPAFQP